MTRPRAEDIAPSAASGIDPRTAVRATLARYEAAYSGLNVSAARAVWPAAGAGGLAEARVTRWLGVVVRVDLLAAIGAPDIALATANGNATLFEPGIFSLRSGLGVEIVLP